MVEASLRLSDKEPACQMQETQVWSPGQKDPLEEEMATYSSILTCEIAWTEEHGYSLWDHRRVREDLVTKQQQPHADWSLIVQIVLTLKRLSQKKKKKKKKEKKRKKERKEKKEQVSLKYQVLHDFFPPAIHLNYDGNSCSKPH